jgi:secondary thiamine-phosphate synthase enzyme
MPLSQAQTTLEIATRSPGFTDLTERIAGWLTLERAGTGVLTAFVRHTSASLTIQENADPAVLADLATALERLAPRSHPWRHATEGPDDMPAHVRSMLTGASLSIPVSQGAMTLGTWQAVYLVEHRDRPHRREVVLAFIGTIGAQRS